MEAGKRGSGDLLPGLPEELVQAHLVPRLPWYTRPVCRAISKSWRSCIDTCKTLPELKLKTRIYQLPLLRGLCLICTFDTHIFISRDRFSPEEPKATYFSVQWRNCTYQIHRQWRKLPPLQGLLRQPPTQAMMVASSGMVYVWSNEEPTFVLKLDMGSGDWTWNKFSVPHRFNGDAFDFNGKIYIPQVSTGETEDEKQEAVLAYDMITDQCELVKTWNRDNMRVILNPSCGEEEMYSFVEHESVPDEKLELLVYDACSDSWKTRDKMPIPECRWSELPEVKLLNGHCFEPAPETGTNTIWIDSEGEVISWFNPSLHGDWVEFNYNTVVKGKGLEYIQVIRGSLYGLFIEDKDDQDDEEEKNRDCQEQGIIEGEQDPALHQRTIMRGRMCVGDSDVQWEELCVVGCFEESYYLKPAVVSPIDHYTFMA